MSQLGRQISLERDIQSQDIMEFLAQLIQILIARIDM